ncbi:MAG: TadE family protein [Actinomycetota bacterium]
MRGISTNYGRRLHARNCFSAASTQSGGNNGQVNRKNGKDATAGRERGTATVEFAAVLPLVAVAMLCVAQVSLLVWNHMRVAHAAREGARELAVTNDVRAAEAAALRAGSLDASRATILIGPDDRPAGTSSRVTVRYRARMVVPFIARFAPEIEVTGTVWMRVERDPP